MHTRRDIVRLGLSALATALVAPSTAAGDTTTYRSIIIDGEEVEFSDGFTDLHTRSYEEIIAGNGFGLEIVRPSVEIVSAFRTRSIELCSGEHHPLVASYVRM